MRSRVSFWLIICLSSIVANGLLQFFDSIIPLILKENYFINDFTIGIAIMWANILAVIGVQSVKLFSSLKKNYKFRLFLDLVVILFCIFCMQMLELDYLSFLVYYIISIVSVNIFKVTYSSFMISNKDLNVSFINSVAHFVGAVGSVLILGAISLFVKTLDDYNYIYAFIVILILIILVLILIDRTSSNVVEVREKKLETSLFNYKVSFQLIAITCINTSYVCVANTFSRYAKEIWGMSGSSFVKYLIITNVSAIVAYVPCSIVFRKMNSFKVLLLSELIICICMFLMIFMVKPYNFVYLILILYGVGYAMFGNEAIPCLLKLTNPDTSTALYYSSSLIARIVTPAVIGVLLDVLSYKIVFRYASVFCFVAIVLSFIVALKGDKK